MPAIPGNGDQLVGGLGLDESPIVCTIGESEKYK